MDFSAIRLLLDPRRRPKAVRIHLNDAQLAAVLEEAAVTHPCLRATDKMLSAHATPMRRAFNNARLQAPALLQVGTLKTHALQRSCRGDPRRHNEA